jgi:hypothetical protein
MRHQHGDAGRLHPSGTPRSTRRSLAYPRLSEACRAQQNHARRRARSMISCSIKNPSLQQPPMSAARCRSRASRSRWQEVSNSTASAVASMPRATAATPSHSSWAAFVDQLRHRRGPPFGYRSDPSRTVAPAVFAVFAGKYQQPLTFRPQKFWPSGAITTERTAGFGLFAEH